MDQPSPVELPPLALTFPDPAMIESTDGTSIATYDLGGDGSDMVMVHATGFCAGVWGPVASRLTGHRRAALDVRGHGRSAAPAAGMHWDGTAQDVLATIDALGLEQPFGVGHSMGGASLVLAELARPGTFRGLWIYEPIIFPPMPPDAPHTGNFLADGARRRRAEFPSAAAAYANFAGKPPFSALDPAALAAYVTDGFETLEDGRVQLRCRAELEAQTYEMGGRHDAFVHLGELRCPVTVARGHSEVPGPAGLAGPIADAIPAGVLEEHPELGHFGPLEQPSTIAGSIDAAITASS